MLYAKSELGESIREHTASLVENYKILEEIYKDSIDKNISMDSKIFWNLLNIAVLYHDTGKVFTPFQNVIRKKLSVEELQTTLENNIPHNYLSPMFVPYKAYDINGIYKKLLVQAIGYHHERDVEVDSRLIEEAIEKDLKGKLEELQEEMGKYIRIRKNLNSKYVELLKSKYRICEKDEEYYNYVMLKGLLQRIDYAASAHIGIEEKTSRGVGECTKNYVESKFAKLRDVQKYAFDNKDNNLILIASTGIGKTESALLWIDDSKAFFTLPLRVSINALYSRVKEEIKYENTGLIHSTSRDYLEEKEYETSSETYEQSALLSKKLSFSTIDQIFKFPFKYRGYERIYATMAYSKIVIDEIQAYSPEISAVILKGLTMLYKIGGRFLLMTATLPRIYTDYLEREGIKFEKKQFTSSVERHKINVIDENVNSGVKKIIEKGKTKKVIVIVNTVKKAIELYKIIKEENKFENVYLLHSLFIQEDRAVLENEIKEFTSEPKANEPGIWITTQIVEASLDVDFDYLFTELSTLDSLFQRFGRCYRKRPYGLNGEPNVFIYTKEPTGKGTIYDEDIVNFSENAIKVYDMKMMREEEKIRLVDELYSEEKLKNTEFWQKFKSSLKVLDNILDYDLSSKEAQKLLRDIDSLRVIPREIFDKNMDLILSYNSAAKEEKYDILREINKLTINLPQYKCRGKITAIENINNLYIIDVAYNSKKGILLDEEASNIG